MTSYQITHAQQRYGQADDAPVVSHITVKDDSQGGVYIVGHRELPSAIRWGCSRTYRGVSHEQAMRNLAYENGQRLLSMTVLED